jgi:hypothetical protein
MEHRQKRRKTEYRKGKWAVSLLMVLALMIPCVTVWAEEPEPEEELGLYFYYMSVENDGVDGNPIEMKLYACTTQAGAEILEGASFGLRVPKYMGKLLKFVASDQVIIQPVVPEERYRADARQGLQIYDSEYHGFAWTRYVKEVDPAHEREDVTQWTPGAPDSSTEASPAVGHILVGTYTFDTKGAVPSASSVGQKDWEQTLEAVAKENGETVLNLDDVFNKTVWSREKAAYIGYYMKDKSTATLGQTPLKLVFSPPKTWNGIFSVQSYDPKDQLTVYIRPAEAPAEGPAYYRVEPAVQTTGTGLFVQTIRFAESTYYIEDGKEELKGKLPEGKYVVELKKESHVTATLIGLTVTADTIFPELDGKAVRLACGDVTGDGRIRQADRGELMKPGRYNRKAETVGNGSLYDLDGDGRIDQKDLAILTAPENYGKNDFSIGFTETRNVGENGV